MEVVPGGIGQWNVRQDIPVALDVVSHGFQRRRGIADDRCKTSIYFLLVHWRIEDAVLKAPSLPC